MKLAVINEACVQRYPLTLTLSLGEREQPSPRFAFSDTRPANPVAAFRVRLDTIPPLPKGEGRGEGKRRILTTAA